MSDHAKLSPSAAERWMTCPGSVVLSEGMPNESSKFAEEGTRAHAVGEAMLKGERCQVAPEMLEHVLVYVDHIEELAAQLGAVLHIEQRVKVTDNIWGTADATIWRPLNKTLFVRDLKYGAGVPVEVQNNLQLKVYALAALLTMGYPAEWVDVGIVQPRCPHPDGPIRSTVFKAVDLIDFHADLLDAAKRVAEVQEHFKQHKTVVTTALSPSEKGCRWCPAAPKCPKLKSKAQELARTVFAPNVPYNPLELAETLDFLPILEGWIKNTREFAYSQAETGHVVPGYKLVEKRASRKWRPDVDKLLLAQLLNVGLVSIFKPEEMLPVTEIQKLAPGKNDKERAALLEPFVIKESSGHTLVHESDARDPVRVDAKAAFTEGQAA